MYCMVNDLGGLEVHANEEELCYNCKNLFKCPLMQALSKEYVILHYSEIRVKECALFKR